VNQSRVLRGTAAVQLQVQVGGLEPIATYKNNATSEGALLHLPALFALEMAASTSANVLLESPRSPLLPSPLLAPTTPGVCPTALSYVRGLLVLRLLRGLVSKRKRRFLDADTGLDLDFSYITAQLIATGYPSTGLESLYRNPAASLRGLLAARHGLQSCRAWNLCIERGYDAPSLLGCSAHQSLTWFDHTPPPASFLRPLCEDLEGWVKRGKVAVIRACSPPPPPPPPKRTRTLSHIIIFSPHQSLLWLFFFFTLTHKAPHQPTSPASKFLASRRRAARPRRLQGGQGSHGHAACRLAPPQW
jgi:hypothetical protein